MTDLRTVLGEAVGAAFAAEGVAPELARVTPSDRPDLADFQSNGALAAAKAAPTASPRTVLRSVIYWAAAVGAGTPALTRKRLPVRLNSAICGVTSKPTRISKLSPLVVASARGMTTT